MITKTMEIEAVQAEANSWTIDVECPEIEELRRRYSQHMSVDEFNRSLWSAARLLAHCPNPRGRPIKRTGLAIGKIQSGKTLSFTILIALAAANGYNKVIVLAGTKKSLHRQTSERLDRDLTSGNYAVANRITIFRNPRGGDVNGIRGHLEMNRCAVISVMKNVTHIRNAAKILESAAIPKGPTLIIDDEGDEASLNSYFRTGEQSAVYSKIQALRQAVPCHAYLAYTATPQSNLLLETVDNLSPDFCELIEPGSGYCGGSLFFGAQSYTRFVREITDVPEDGTLSVIPESLQQALAIFFVGAAIRHSRLPRRKHSMLILTTHIRAGHEQMWTAVENLLDNWKTRLASRRNDPNRQQLMTQFKQGYDDLIRTVSNPPPWDEIQEALPSEVTACQPHMVNSLPEGTQIAEQNFTLENNIVIGGNILGRGVTIQDLTTSYMVRRARNTNVDTVEQRARWFGYKAEYIDICRIFLPTRAIEDYRGILEHEDDFWDSLRRNIRQGIQIRGWPRFFQLDSNLRMNPTRRSVARYKEFRPGGWDTQRTPIEDIGSVSSNKIIIQRFFSRHRGADENVGTTHTFVRECPVTEVISELLGPLSFTGTGWEKEYYIEYLTRLSEAGRLGSVDVVLMSRGNERHRQLDGSNINNLMEGRRANYRGDREVHNNKVQLQIHYVTITDASRNDLFQTTAVAIYVPNNPQLDMSFIVRGETE